MKTLRLFMMMTGLLLASLTFQSCMDDDGYSLGDFWVAIATVETDEASDSHYFRLDDGSKLWPASGYYTGHNLDERQRVILNYTVLSDELKNSSRYVKVNDLYQVLTKPIAEDKVEGNDSFYGTDPVELKDMWVANGFLTIFFKANYSGEVKHFVNLVKNDRVETTDGSVYLEFRHNAYNDAGVYSVTGPVCFELDTLNTTGEAVKLTIAVSTTGGMKTYNMTYDPKNPFATRKQELTSTSSGHIENIK